MIYADTDLAPGEFDIAPPSTVASAAQLFASALAETAQFRAFETASAGLREDRAAQRAMAVYQRLAESLRPMRLLNAVDIAQQDELDRLYQSFANLPTVIAYREAQEGLTALCQLTAGLLSQHIGLDFAAACGASCCA